MAKKLKKKAEQLEMGGKDWAKFLSTDLGIAMGNYVTVRKKVEALNAELEEAGSEVVTQMKKAGKQTLDPVVDDVMYHFEVRKTSVEKLVFKRATE